MATQFIYSISTQTLNGIVALNRITNEIRSSSITIALVGATQSDDNLIIDFKVNISVAEESTLDSIVSSHTGKSTIEDPTKFQIVDSNGDPIDSIDDSGIKRLAFDVGESTIVGPQGDQGIQGIQGIQGPAGQGSDFGSEYNYAVEESESSTTSGSYQQKLKLTTSALSGGDYRITWYYEAYTTDIDMNIRVQLNDSQTISEVEHTSADGGDKHYWSSFSGYLPSTTLISGAHTIDIDYNDDGGGQAKIRRARLELWKVL